MTINFCTNSLLGAFWFLGYSIILRKHHWGSKRKQCRLLLHCYPCRNPICRRKTLWRIWYGCIIWFYFTQHFTRLNGGYVQCLTYSIGSISVKAFEGRSVGLRECGGHIGRAALRRLWEGVVFQREPQKRRLYLFDKVKGDDLDVTEVQIQYFIWRSKLLTKSNFVNHCVQDGKCSRTTFDVNRNKLVEMGWCLTHRPCSSIRRLVLFCKITRSLLLDFHSYLFT